MMNSMGIAEPTRSATVHDAPSAVGEQNDVLRMVCSEIWGGNRAIRVPVELPGVRATLFSAPCDGGRGGDIHYLSVCGSGLLTRGCIADVAGHGEAVSRISGELHTLMRRNMNWPDQRRVLAKLNRRVVEFGFRAMTTAAAFTYYPPAHSLSISCAGHPPAWLWRKQTGAWSRFPALPEGRARSHGPRTSELSDLPLGVEENTTFTRHRARVAYGDRLVLLTDGVLEAPAPDGELFGDARVDALLRNLGDRPTNLIAQALLDAVAQHVGASDIERTDDADGQPLRRFKHDDVTLLVAEFVPASSAPALWQVIRNRIMRPRGNSDSGRFAEVPR